MSRNNFPVNYQMITPTWKYWESFQKKQDEILERLNGLKSDQDEGHVKLITAAKLLDCGVKTIQGYIDDGLLTPQRNPQNPNIIRLKKSDVLNFVQPIPRINEL